MSMKWASLFICIIFLLSCSKKEVNDTVEKKQNQSVECNKIYGNGETYCAFTSLVKRGDSYYLAFREGKSHVAPGDYGVIRLLKSNDADSWTLIQTISKDECDLRDPSLSMMPNGNLMLICGVRTLRADGLYETKTALSVESSNGEFCKLDMVKIPEMEYASLISWIWRITWFQEFGYGVCYKTDDGENYYLSLLKTKDGKSFDYVSEIPLSAIPSETKLGFLSDGTCLAFIRCDLDKANGYLASSRPPYTEWSFKILDIHVAGHDFLIENNEKIVMVTRQTYNVGSSTCVYWGTLDGNMRWSYRLPSRLKGDDTSYACIIDDGDRYVISYHTMEKMDKPGIFVVKFPKSCIPICD